MFLRLSATWRVMGRVRCSNHISFFLNKSSFRGISKIQFSRFSIDDKSISLSIPIYVPIKEMFHHNYSNSWVFRMCLKCTKEFKLPTLLVNRTKVRDVAPQYSVSLSVIFDVYWFRNCHTWFVDSFRFTELLPVIRCSIVHWHFIIVRGNRTILQT